MATPKKRKTHHRIFVLADQIERESNWVKVSTKLEQLRDYLYETGPADGILAGTNRILYGKGSSATLIEKMTDAPENVKELLCQTIATVFYVHRGSATPFLQWVMNQVNKNGDYWTLKILDRVIDVQQNNEYKLTGPKVGEIILPEFLNFLSVVSDYDMIELTMSILKKLSTRYPDIYETRFEEITGVLFGITTSNSVGDCSKQVVCKWIEENTANWSSHIAFAIHLLLSFTKELEEGFSVQCEPGKPYQPLKEKVVVPASSLWIANNVLTVLNAVFQNCWGFVIASRIFHDQILHVLHWNIEIFSTVGFKVLSTTWFRTFYKLIHLVLRVSPTVAIRNRIDEILIKHYHLAKQEYDQGEDFKSIHEWIEFLSILLPNHVRALPNTIVDLFLNPETSFLMKEYRIQVISKLNCLERLQNSTSQFLGIPGAAEKWINEIQQLFDLMAKKSLKDLTPTDSTGYNRLKMSRLQKLAQFDISCLKYAAETEDSSKKGYFFRTFMNFHQMIVSEGYSDTHSAWVSIESHCLMAMLEIGTINGFFFPKLSTPKNAKFEFQDILDYQVVVLKQLGTPNHFGHNSMGLLWLRSWVEFVKDKNRLDTLVGESLVLSTMESLLIRYLKKCSLQADPLIRLELGSIWLLYLQSFGGNRRSESNTAMILKLFLQRTQDIDSGVQHVYFSCICNLDAFDTLISVESLPKALRRDYVEEFKHLVMSSPSSGAFTTAHFKLMASYLGMESYLLTEGEALGEVFDCDDPSNEWLRQLYFGCQTEHVFGLLNADPVISLAGQSSFECLIFWALWETARFFIISRLKTPFGTPLQSFDAIEKTLEMYLKLFEAATKHSEAEETIIKYMQRFSYFLAMIDMLELQITVAAKGSSTTCPAPPKPCLVFFSGNHKVCQEWLGKVRSRLSTSAELLQEDGLILRHSFRSLYDGIGVLRDKAIKHPEVWNSIVRNSLLSIASTLVTRKDHDGLVGLYSLWKRNTSMVPSDLELANPNVLKILGSSIQLAEGRVESGVRILQEVNSTNSYPKIRHYVQEQLLYCYSSLGDWQEIKACLDSFKAPINDHEKYYSGDLKALSFWTQSSNNSLDFDLISELIYRKPTCTVDHLSFSEIYDTFRGIQVDLGSSINIIQGISNIAYSKSTSPLTVQNLIWTQCMTSFNIETTEMDTGTQVRLGKAKASDRVTGLSFSGSDLLQLKRLYSLCKMAEKLGRARKIRDPDLDEIGGLLANLARNTKNLGLAHNLLDSSHSTLTLSASLRKQYKHARLLYQERKLSEATQILVKVLSTQLPSPSISDQETMAKSALLLSHWYSNPSIDFSKLESIDILKTIFGGGFPDNFASLKQEEKEYRILKHAITVSPDYSKSWFHYGSFNYKLGRSLLEELSATFFSSFFEVELKQLALILKGTELTTNMVMKSLLQDLREKEYEGDLIEWKEGPGIDSIKIERIEQLLGTIRTSIFEKFDIASKAYFRYLHVQGSSNLQTEKLKRKQGDIITGTLRLIRIFAKYGVALHETFRTGFQDTPLPSWKDVIPQLFSRLYHPEPIVCLEITNLLCRITSEYPHLMCYPAALGAKEIEDDENQVIHDAYDKILAKLSEENPSLIPEMNKWTEELQRITVLWEEIWQTGLEHLKSEMVDRIAKIEQDLSRIGSNTTLSEMERIDIKESTLTNILKPVLFAIDKLCEQTFRLGTSTPHELDFVQRFQSRIENGYEMLENVDDLDQVKDAWNIYLGILQEVVRDSIKARTTPLELSLLSPYLSGLSSTNIYIPGIGLDDEMVAVCSQSIRVLPTKTKPKKLELISTTGEKYTYLLKGHEDLHLDERIQQFLGIANVLLFCDKQTRNRSLTARTYNVIPFGNSYGMIQWVENAHGLFSFYRKWQLHEFSVRTANKKEGENIPQPPRPQEMFVRKVMQAHREGKLDKTQPRNQWPLKTMVEIFQQLKKETPSDILANEIWTSSYSSDNWWLKTNCFSRSLAVMSIIGYTLGLGDRHLDNILIDLNKGEAVHIDFNVCFEKGKRLRVPETVPFRLTQNLLRALGPSGIDGHFRIACENVLRVMRENREILLTLLEAFIYDPLVDWTKQDGLEKQILNLNVNIGLLSSRINELKSTLQDHSLEFPVHSLAIVHELRELHRDAKMQSELLKEREDILQLDDEKKDQVTGELENSCKLLNSSLIKIHEVYRHKSLRHQEYYSCLSNNLVTFLSQESLPLAIRDSMVSLYIDERNDVWKFLCGQLKWYQGFYGSELDLFAAQDMSSRISNALSGVSRYQFSNESCENAIKLLSEKMYNPQSETTAHLSELRKAIAVNERQLDTLKFLNERLNMVDNDETAVNTNQMDELLYRSCFLHILVYFGKLIQSYSQGDELEEDLDYLYGEETPLLVETLEMITENSLLQLPESKFSPLIVSNMLLRSKIQSLSSLRKIHNAKFKVPLISDILFDQLDYFDKTFVSCYRFAELLTSEILPEAFRLLGRKEASIDSLIKILIEFGQDCTKTLLLERQAFNSKSVELRKKLEHLETRLVEGNATMSLLKTIGSAVNLFQQTKIEAISDSCRNKVYLRAIVAICTMLSDGRNYFKGSLLLLSDPTVEFAGVFDLSQLTCQPEFQTFQNAFHSLMDLISQELFYTPLYITLELIVKSVTNKLGKNITKTWNTNSKFNENTMIPFVDISNKHLNYFVKTGAVDFEKLEILKDYCIKKGVHHFVTTLSSETVTSMNQLQCLIDKQESHLERYQMLHATQIFEKSEHLEKFERRTAFLSGVQSGIATLKELNTKLQTIIPKCKDPKLLGILEQQKDCNDQFLAFCSALYECEYERLPSSDMVLSVQSIVAQLDSLYKSKRKMESLKNNGMIPMIDGDLSKLHIKDTKANLKQSTKKLNSFFESLKAIIDPVLRITDNIVTNAKGTNFSQDVLKEMMSLKKQWRAIREHHQQLYHEINRALNSLDLELLNSLVSKTTVLSDMGALLIEKVLEHVDLEEILLEDDQEEVEESSDDEQDTKPRRNRMQSKNMTALNALKQIRAKLEGRDTADRSRVTVSEQINGLIMAATAPEHLAVMYEGWMSWI